jgi:flagellar biosynthesis protein FlhG
VLSGARRAVETLIPIADGVRLLPGRPSDQPPALDREAVGRFLAEIAALSQQSDVLVFDAGAGMNPWVDRLWQVARQVLVVTPPLGAAILDAYAAVKLSQFHRLDGKVRLVFNRSSHDAETRPLATRFDETCERFLAITTQPAVCLPDADPDKPSSPESLARAMRLLAADLACEFRASTLRFAVPSFGSARARNPQPLGDRR